MLLGIVHRVFPNATLIHCRRNLIDTALSIYTTNFETSLDFVADRSDIVFFFRPFQPSLDRNRILALAGLQFINRAGRQQRPAWRPESMAFRIPEFEDLMLRREAYQMMFSAFCWRDRDSAPTATNFHHHRSDKLGFPIH
jgi:hypothetical protein